MFEKRASGKAALVVDVDDISVGVAVVETHADQPAALIMSERMMSPIEARDAAQSASAIVQLLEKCTDSLLKKYSAAGGTDASALTSIKSISIFLRAPWTRFRSAQADESYTEPKKTTQEAISALAKKAMSTISELDTANILESGAMEVFLNGYPTGSPIGKVARTIAVAAFESDVNTEMKQGVASVFNKLLPGRETTIRSGTRALLTVLHEHIPDIHRYCLLDVGGSATSCSVVRKEMVTQHAEAPEGIATIARRVAGAGLPEEVLAQIRMLMNDTCSTEACKTAKEALAKAEPELVKVYGDMFSSLAQKRRLPNRAILVAPADIVPWLETFFSRIDFAQFTATTQPLEVEPLTSEHVLEIVTIKPGARPDTELAIGAACVNILERIGKQPI